MSAWTPAEYAAAVRNLPGVEAVTLVGSRAMDTVNVLSDTDYAVRTRDFPATARALEALLATHPALAAQWDPFPGEVTYMLLLPGARKVDFIFGGEPVATRGPWDPTIDPPAAIEAHFWDWLLWLGSKQLKGDHALVAAELAKMHDRLLRPLGVRDAPASLDGALRAFERWRAGEAAGRLRRRSKLREDILPELRSAGVIGGNPG